MKTLRRTITIRLDPEEQEYIVSALKGSNDRMEEKLKVPNDPSEVEVQTITGAQSFNQEIIDEINSLGVIKNGENLVVEMSGMERGLIVAVLEEAVESSQTFLKDEVLPKRDIDEHTALIKRYESLIARL